MTGIWMACAGCARLHPMSAPCLTPDETRAAAGVPCYWGEDAGQPTAYLPPDATLAALAVAAQEQARRRERVPV